MVREKVLAKCWLRFLGASSAARHGRLQHGRAIPLPSQPTHFCSRSPQKSEHVDLSQFALSSDDHNANNAFAFLFDPVGQEMPWAVDSDLAWGLRQGGTWARTRTTHLSPSFDATSPARVQTWVWMDLA
ncbi:hypothetical protein B0H34DRAFT_671777 [Crassisporium funariophilum]|nr:hypothetical protein B0H34DRAFT_671777 [Crassisporium funariophilum]